MSALIKVKVDGQKRVRLSPFANPGEVYRLEAPEPGQIVLRRAVPKSKQARMTYDEALAAVANSGLDFSASYDELRKLTRES